MPGVLSLEVENVGRAQWPESCSTPGSNCHTYVYDGADKCRDFFQSWPCVRRLKASSASLL